MSGITDPAGMFPEKSVSYKSYFKEAVVIALRQVFNKHPDQYLQTKYDAGGNVIGGTNVTVEYPTDQKDYPSVIVRYQEAEVKTAGVGHLENLYNETSKVFEPYRHTYYNGSLQLVCQALTSVDLDLVTDSVMQIIRMPDMAAYTNQFFNEIFNTELPVSNLNYVNINLDNIQGIGESVFPQPWLSENQLVYQAGYRTKVFGEFYSLPQNTVAAGLIEHVQFFPYIESLGQVVPSGYIVAS